ncbi:MAG: hypothetical protein M1438_07470 [Deltaproteobacteria bacterium]|nr:hypothetical protein [Deltaproteobacteria bacterium]
MLVSSRTRYRAGCQGWLTPMVEERLDRALVAGLLLEVFLEAPAVPVDPQIRSRDIKSRLTYAMVKHLAGRVTLDRFRTLMQRLDDWFPYYYPLMPPLPKSEPEKERPASKTAANVGPIPPSLVRQDHFKEWLEKAAPEILPRRPQGKLQAKGLEDFLQLAQGSWFRLKDLARHFGIDRKTAWEYVQKLQEAGLLIHNHGRSAAVRYRLADHFLKVKLTSLEQEVALALTGWPAPAAAQVTQGLASTAGEPFWEEHWPISPAGQQRQEIIASLNRAGLLEVVCQSGERRMLRLPRRWLALTK